MARGRFRKENADLRQRGFSMGVRRVAGSTVVDRAFQVLRALPEHQPPGQVAAIARATGVPRPTVHRVLGQLVDAEAVVRTPNGFALAAGLTSLSPQAAPIAGLRAAADIVLAGLREQTGTSVSLVVPQGENVIALRMVSGRDPLPVELYDGLLLPQFCAAAIALDPHLDPGRVDSRFGSAVDDEHVQPGVSCYAVPLPPITGVRAAVQICTTGPAAKRLAPFVHQAAGAITERLRQKHTVPE